LLHKLRHKSKLKFKKCVWRLFERYCIVNNEQTWIVELFETKIEPHDPQRDVKIEMSTAQVIHWLSKDGTMQDYTAEITLKEFV